MNVISTVKDDRKYRLLENRMQNPDQQHYLSPQSHNANTKIALDAGAQANTALPALAGTSASSTSAEKDEIETPASSSVTKIDRMSLPLDLSSPPSTIATEVASLVSIVDSVIASIPLVFELLDTDDSKASISSKSQSRSSASIGFKEDKEREINKELKSENLNKSLKRQSNGGFENKSPKVLKTEDIILVDQTAVLNQGSFVRLNIIS